MIIPAEQFSFANQRFTAEASDLIGFGFRNYYPQMFGIRGLRRVEYFILTENIRDEEGDLLVTIYKPKSQYLLDKGVEVHILND